MPNNNISFKSPGVVLNEVDLSQKPGVKGETGPLVIGRALRGPGMVPVEVSSKEEFYSVFGGTVPGGNGSDAWRNGDTLSPMFGTYAADAWLTNGNKLTYVRLLGQEHEQVATGGEAGWKASSTGLSANRTGGAFGLFVYPSASAATAVTGTLAAVWYLTTGSICLSGNLRGTTTPTVGTAAIINSDSNGVFTACVKDDTGAITDTLSFSLNASSDRYVRNVFSTNPTLVNSDITNSDLRETYWLGETMDLALAEMATGATMQGFIMGLKLNGGTEEANDNTVAAQASKTGWFISQDISGRPQDYNPENMTKLFRLVSLDSGDWNQKNIKISIKDIKPGNAAIGQFGTFTVQIREMGDRDGAVKSIETFTNCSLNPADESTYIVNKIGDQYVSFDTSTRMNTVIGLYPNRSRYVRVEVSPEVEAGMSNSELIPFGVLGPLVYKGFAMFSGSANYYNYGASLESESTFNPFVVSKTNIPDKTQATKAVDCGTLAFTGTFSMGKIRTRATSQTGSLPRDKDVYFGVCTDGLSPKYIGSFGDMLRAKPASVDSFTPASYTDYAFKFSLDDLRWVNGSTSKVEWVTGSRATSTTGNPIAGSSITAGGAYNNAGTFAATTPSYKNVLNAGFNKFTTVLHGGTDGLDITEKDAFRNTLLGSGSETTNYAINSVKRAIDMCRDPEQLTFNLASIPGIWDSSLTAQLIDMCESRGDALAIIDIESDWVQDAEGNFSSKSDQMAVPSTAVTDLQARSLDSTYGAAYYPSVKIKDNANNKTLMCPPSPVVLGAIAYNDRIKAPWFAPAGLTSGGLTSGAGGIPVLDVAVRLTQEQRDSLYEANINPIAKFPGEGVVIWGQKTLAALDTALNRVNVRRLMIEVKREIGKISSSFLFSNNVTDTWTRFKSQCDAPLSSIRDRYGITEFKVVLDEKTTTADLIDRNIMYAKIWIKPARAIEGIWVDFNITSSGINF